VVVEKADGFHVERGPFSTARQAKFDAVLRRLDPCRGGLHPARICSHASAAPGAGARPACRRNCCGRAAGRCCGFINAWRCIWQTSGDVAYFVRKQALRNCTSDLPQRSRKEQNWLRGSDGTLM